ncbi:hypothetical protein [Asticcacaulis excentricus]|uniref:hypothetical protein n=1 Tax=Asticcacaulis excentricus TaxID=78587 RepID=UPI00059F85B6|nr:hypothetical protein [Asticcacaulis excentricus]
MSETFLLRQDAEAWARRVECEIDAGKTPTPKNIIGINTFRGLIDLHLADMKEVEMLILGGNQHSPYPPKDSPLSPRDLSFSGRLTYHMIQNLHPNED